MTARDISNAAKKQYLAEIFGTQEGSTKYYGLVDSESSEKFDIQLQSLKVKWNDREAAHGHTTRKETFYEWFQREKV